MLSSLEEIEHIVEKQSGMLFRIAMHHVGTRNEAEDITQEVFLRLVRSNPQFASEDHEKAWLIRTTIHICDDFLKTAWHRKIVSLSDNVDKEIGPVDDSVELLPIIRTLPEKYRNVVYLFYYEDMPVAKISDILGVGENTVSSWLFRARLKLKEMLKGEWDNV